MKCFTVAFVAFFFLAFSAEAGTTVFTNVNVISMNDEGVIENRSVVVTDGKISTITGTDKVELP